MNSFATPPLTETRLPFYQSSSPVCLDPKHSLLNNSDSVLTCNNIPPSSAAPRKRQRDSMVMMRGKEIETGRAEMMLAIQQGITMKLKEKDDEIQRMGKLNWVLQERVRSLWVENQIWRDLAHTNEATANSLSSDLEQVLAHVGEDRRASAAGNDQAAVVEDDAKLSPNSLMAKS
ncbi:E3 ubiquitin-protein ligase BOI-like [Ziziphus jujuba]|uniref:E3 ubiquitin-protein ligase BOI-like n=1 Tax=Ziziphus jujuba TaxID=326968 RepID=A0ABM3ZWQ3_ZIZJJ|nr:E3 ubiquitin-protein ligase BOI-like [Ziziphus jujuba]